VDKNRGAITEKYPDFKHFKNLFIAGDTILRELIKYAEDRSIKYKSSEFEISKESLSTFIKALIARNIWSNNEFFEIFNVKDVSVNRAVEVINNWDNYWVSK